MMSMMSQLPPHDAHWMPLSELQQVVSEYWGETGTIIFVLTVRDDPTCDDALKVRQVLGSQGLFAVLQESSIQEAIQRGVRASAFLVSLPERLPKKGGWGQSDEMEEELTANPPKQ